ncbi:MAG: type II toxin-antitoxin system PemK/MazF family toxin [Aphanocapsa sp. GSE-SYN-MK-11-07L]|jgi:hypothetical protein|nr:type II toxin-antitoxin system PemK/MazF family toxin [Aphanocapsa sp. GSE-SYN-MK-11-07L]
MSKKVSITLDAEVLDFVDQSASNRSRFINQVLWEEKKEFLAKIWQTRTKIKELGNQNGATTIVAPLMPGAKTYPFVVNVAPTSQNGLDRERRINLSQIRAVDASRIKNKQGVLDVALHS